MKLNFRKIGFWTGLVVVIGILLTMVILRISLNPQISQENQINQIALKKTPIKEIKENYHLRRDIHSDSVYGVNGQKKYYFIYVPKTKKGYLYQNSEGFSKKKIIKKFNKNHLNREISTINLGWYKKRPVWEVSYRKQNGKIGYVIYSFEKGTELSYIDNL